MKSVLEDEVVVLTERVKSQVDPYVRYVESGRETLDKDFAECEAIVKESKKLRSDIGVSESERKAMFPGGWKSADLFG